MHGHYFFRGKCGVIEKIARLDEDSREIEKEKNGEENLKKSRKFSREKESMVM